MLILLVGLIFVISSFFHNDWKFLADAFARFAKCTRSIFMFSRLRTLINWEKAAVVKVH